MTGKGDCWHEAPEDSLSVVVGRDGPLVLYP